MRPFLFDAVPNPVVILIIIILTKPTWTGDYPCGFMSAACDGRRFSWLTTQAQLAFSA